MQISFKSRKCRHQKYTLAPWSTATTQLGYISQRWPAYTLYTLAHSHRPYKTSSQFDVSMGVQSHRVTLHQTFMQRQFLRCSLKNSLAHSLLPKINIITFMKKKIKLTKWFSYKWIAITRKVNVMIILKIKYYII